MIAMRHSCFVTPNLFRGHRAAYSRRWLVRTGGPGNKSGVTEGGRSAPGYVAVDHGLRGRKKGGSSGEEPPLLGPRSGGAVTE